MNYQQTIEWMFAQLPMYQKEGKKAFKKDLTNSKAFAKHLKNPERKFTSIHVGGTNGKGSTSHMIASILQEAGYKVGLYTSPHLKNFTERIRINGNEVSKDFVVDFIERNKEFLEQHSLSFFEMTVGMAFDYFAREKVAIAIVEVGMGGRLDSTNIITPEVSVITNIGYDHIQFLGNTLPKIAAEKAGIIKQNIPVVIGEKQQEVQFVFEQKAKESHSPLIYASDIKASYTSDLLGDYQKHNAKTAVCAINQLKSFLIRDTHIKHGLLNVVNNTHLKGRWQTLHKKPLSICDTAHNKEGLRIVMQQIQKQTYKDLHVVLGMVNDKDLESVLPLFPKKAYYYFCRPNIPRGLSAENLQIQAATFGLQGKTYPSVAEAYKQAMLHANSNDLIYIGGSTFVVAEVI